MKEREVLVAIPGFMPSDEDFIHIARLLSPRFEWINLGLPNSSDLAESITASPTKRLEATEANATDVNATDTLTLGNRAFERRIRDWYQEIQPRLPKHFYLLGYSMGGRLALALAKIIYEQRPSQIRGLILESAHPGLADEEQKSIRRQADNRWAQRFATEPLARVLADWYQQAVFSSLSEGEKGQLISMKIAHYGDTGRLALSAQLYAFGLSQQADYSDFIVSGRLPVSYISGALDAKFTAIATRLVERTKKSSARLCHLLALDAGHNIHFQNPQWMAESILESIDFFKK